MTVKNEITHKVELKIEEEPYIEMMKYAHEFSPNECSGVGLVERVDYNDQSVEFVVKKVFLPNQRNTAGTTDIDDEDLNKLNTDLVIAGEDTSLLKFHWHSHVDMSVFHSGTDEENYDEMGTGEYAVSLVVNKKYDMLGSVHLYDPLRINLLNIEVNPPDIDLDKYDLPTALLKKIKDNVARVKAYEEAHRPVIVHNTGYSHCKTCGKSYFYCTCQNYVCSVCKLPYAQCDCYSTNHSTGGTYGMGVADDKDFIALLIQAEKAGIIQLIHDDDYNKTIVGYVNMRTKECYEINTYLDYCTY